MSDLFGLAMFIAIIAIPFMIASAIKERAAKKEEEFQLKNPEAWRAKELVKLEKERFAAQKKLAEEEVKRDASRRNVGLFFGIGRGLGWW